MALYRNVLVKSYAQSGEASSAVVRIHPLAGQGLSEKLNVECSKSMRRDYPVGTIFRIRAKITDREGGVFVYSYFGWPFEVLSDEKAQAFLSGNDI